jgi:hypothetical protein
MLMSAILSSEICHPDVFVVDLGKDLMEHGLDAIVGCHAGVQGEGGWAGRTKKKFCLPGVKTTPCGIELRRKVFSHRPRKPLNPSPLTQGPHSPSESWVGAAHGWTVTTAWAGPWPVLWRMRRGGDFFNLNLKFTPTGSQTQDLRSATRAN